VRLKNHQSAPPFWQKAEETTERVSSDPELIVDLEGFEGPLDLLLHLARKQKVDLAQISLMALVEQYLAFIDAAQKLRLELAADYLVMAAWLAYLKSRLLLPKQDGEESEAGAELLGEILAFRLKRLEAMRMAAENLFHRDLLGRDVFGRGMPEMRVMERKNRFDLSLYELLIAYTGLRQRNGARQVFVGGRKVWSLEEARSLLERLLGKAAVEDWVNLDHLLLAYLPDEQERISALASSFAVSLEMVRMGEVEIQQSQAFAPLYLRPKATLSADKEHG